ncbi:MAG: transcriptional regulator NrdR [Candidatus Margulisiibacteriota bacterium]|nr:transcriptional regulator NrdR [Candidatus Margulisiibacteriota bacterium]
MKCPFCLKDNDRVVESREIDNGEGVRRRRECISCKKRFTSYERIMERPLWVIKKDKEKELYDRKKILDGLTRACHKRPISSSMIEKIAHDIEKALHKEKGREVKSSRIGEIILKRLKGVDPVAYVRFASVYRDFKDVKGFAEEIKKL